ncbi:hypothetical protein Poli38472_002572 [Pythium oligandrum]|uniref:HTH CENPB-type domain-containing protein n=1 Tax=Pythium oligandrum TaxID=41045 RepID=A0A8K1FIB0_PYTOL|nr:hypothetical protein Poli38472_002572 [Pythium oligandrum]|eukprot:TMW63631.1 hypothetical protein Poli38472_002572 [Pythium oligandrum]
MGPRGAGRRLNDQERMEILDILSKEAKVKNVDLAKRYGVSEGAIRKLKQIKDTIRERYQMGNEQNRDKRKRGGFVRNAKFEQELYEWILHIRETASYHLIPLTQTAVRQQAMILAKKYDSMANFKASPGWFARFCSRHRLDPPVHPPLTAEDGSAISPVLGLAATAAVGDSVPGGPLASAYQVDTSFTAHLTAPVKTTGLENGESMPDQTHLAAAVADASGLSGIASDLTHVTGDVKVERPKESKGEHAVPKPSPVPTEEEIFSLGL